MQNQKGISSLIGIIIILVVAIVAFGGVFAYQHSFNLEKANNKKSILATKSDSTNYDVIVRQNKNEKTKNSTQNPEPNFSFISRITFWRLSRLSG